MLQMCEVSQDLSSFCVVAFVLRTDQGNLQAFLLLLLLLHGSPEAVISCAM